MEQVKEREEIEAKINELVPGKSVAGTFLEIAKLLSIVKDKGLFQATGQFQSLMQWASSGLIRINGNQANECLRVYNFFVRQKGLPEALLKEVGFTKLVLLVPPLKEKSTSEIYSILRVARGMTCTEILEWRRQPIVIGKGVNPALVNMSEKIVRRHIAENHSTIFGPNTRVIDHSWTLADNEVDLIVQVQSSRDLIVVELKKGATYSAVGQVLMFVNALKESKRGDSVFFTRGLYKGHKGGTEESQECNDIYGAIGARTFDTSTYYAALGLPLTFYKFGLDWTYILATIRTENANRTKWDGFQSFTGPGRKDF